MRTPTIGLIGAHVMNIAGIRARSEAMLNVARVAVRAGIAADIQSWSSKMCITSFVTRIG
ncbi:hypothetical protein LG202_22340 [Methylobacillus methanolivorans]